MLFFLLLFIVVVVIVVFLVFFCRYCKWWIWCFWNVFNEMLFCIQLIVRQWSLMNSRLLKLNKFEEIMFQDAFLQILFSHQLRKSIEPHMQLNIIDSAKQKKLFFPFRCLWVSPRKNSFQVIRLLRLITGETNPNSNANPNYNSNEKKKEWLKINFEHIICQFMQWDLTSRTINNFWVQKLDQIFGHPNLCFQCNPSWSKWHRYFSLINIKFTWTQRFHVHQMNQSSHALNSSTI